MDHLSEMLSESVRGIIGEKLPEMATEADSPTPMYSEYAELAIHVLKQLLHKYGWEYDLGFTLCSEHVSWSGYLVAYKDNDAFEFQRAGSTLGESACALIVAFNERIIETKLIVSISNTIQ